MQSIMQALQESLDFVRNQSIEHMLLCANKIPIWKYYKETDRYHKRCEWYKKFIRRNYPGKERFRQRFDWA
jgi:hypothetical protein